MWDAQGKGDLFHKWTGRVVSFLTLANQSQKGEVLAACEYVRVKYQKTLSSSGKYWHRNKYEHVKKRRIDRSVQPKDPVSDVVVFREENKNVSIFGYSQHSLRILKYYRMKKDVTEL